MWRRLIVFVCAYLSLLNSRVQGETKFELEANDSGVTVKVNGEVFTRYVTLSGTKPILWPILGPDGQSMTRGYPMEEVGAHEKGDHPHHRSLWFTHGDVNDLSFWDEPKQGKFGVIRHRRFTQMEGGTTGVLVAESDWLVAESKEPAASAPAGAPLPYQVDDKQVLLRDVRRLTFSVDEQVRIIDFDITLTAAERKVRFGDTKEGSFGVRVPGTMKVDENLGGKIVNREGLANADAWGKRSAWVDYHGPVQENGPIVGIAILHHPTSFRFPTYWHVRTYGLFAANPFGAHNFENSNDVDGSFELAEGQSFRHRYRIILHPGDEKISSIEDRYQKYAELP